MSAIPPGGRTGAGLAEVLALRREVLDRSEALREVRAASNAGGPDAAGRVAASAQGSASQGVSAPGAGFAETLGSALEQVSATQQRSADMQTAYERGEVTDVAKVMLARQEAGVAFEATLQVRNKLLSAYQEIMRMGS